MKIYRSESPFKNGWIERARVKIHLNPNVWSEISIHLGTVEKK